MAASVLRFRLELAHRIPLRHRCVAATVALLVLAPASSGALSSKDVHEQSQSWLSLNTTTRVTDHWGLVGDFHIRRTDDFVEDPGFYFLRFGINAWITDALTTTLGFAHMWKAPAHDDWDTWSNEDRIYEQLQHVSKLGGVGITHRLRNEQRWQQNVTDDDITGKSFTDRIRYLLSVTIPVSNRPAIPSLVVANELHLQFGPGVHDNTFDQDRFFAGIRERLSSSWSFDFGYMPVLQQKSGGDRYDLNHTIRLFFYFSRDFRPVHANVDPAGGDE